MNLPTLPETKLAILVRTRLDELGYRQSTFGALHDFDQGLLSKILRSQVRAINLESCLRLAIGLDVPVIEIFEAIGRPDLQQLLDRAAGNTAASLPERRKRHARIRNANSSV